MCERLERHRPRPSTYPHYCFFRNTAKPGDEERAFGVPSIRTDVRLPKMRSVANAQNYGNEPDAGQLLRPPMAAELGISDEQFVQLRWATARANYSRECVLLYYMEARVQA